MSRAIKLTRIHAINWYGYNDSLPVEGNLLLAGVTGSGKSILMDLIMTVLVGTDVAHNHFNRSATGRHSSRTLKGYCLLDTKREENGVPQYQRDKGVISYIGLEFTWPAKPGEEPHVETWGLRIEFRNAAENHGHVESFYFDGEVSRDDFLTISPEDGKKRPLEVAAFRHFIVKQAALSGDDVSPFDRGDLSANAELLALLPKLLAWRGESLVRFASCVLCGDSKRLEELSGMEREGELRGKLCGKLGRLLHDITGGKVRCLDDLGIMPNPRFVLLSGPLRLRLDGQWLNLGQLHGAFRLAQEDIERAEEVTTTARRCLTIENETSFHELAKLQSGEMLVQTSYPGSGTVKLLQRLAPEIEFWHFGDSDEAGFDILRVLREESGRDFQTLHMLRGRVPFEQESRGRPNRKDWPFYD